MRRSRTIMLVAGLAGIIVFSIAAAGPLMSQVEQPTYTVERSEGPIEVRAYPPMIVAQVTTRGDRRSAISKGFQIIAGYIFGANGHSQKVAMTAPVMQERVSRTGESGTMEQAADDSWVVRFVMPRSWSLETLPKPRDPRITLQAQPAARFAAIRFSGLAGRQAIEEKTRALAAFVAASKLQPMGMPILAFFNPPWTLPFLRRNEVMIQLKAS